MDLRATTTMVSVCTSGGSMRVNTTELAVEDGRGSGTQLELPKTQAVEELIPLITG